MHDPIAAARSRSLPRLRRALLRGWPRVAVGGMVAVTALSGFLASVALLRLDLDGMGLRYAAATLLAYAVFLGQLWIWLALARRRSRGDPLDGLDAAELPRAEGSGPWSGGGGRFSGGGASGRFEAPVVVDAPSAAGMAAPGGTPEGAPAALDLGVDLDLDGWQIAAVVAVAAIAASVAIAAGWIVWSAPALLAEVLFDGVVAGVLYRRVRRGSPRAWWHGALARTWVPAVVVLAFLGIGGRVLEEVVPGARSIGDVLRALTG
jgi:hypothetical protein